MALNVDNNFVYYFVTNVKGTQITFLFYDISKGEKLKRTSNLILLFDFFP